MIIIGHQKIIKFLERSIANNSLVHSYLFVGPSHIGKTLIAKTMAMSLISQEKPCFKCLFKSDIKEKFHPDIIEVKQLLKKEKIGIDQIRELKGKLALTPFSGRYKIAIIEEAERLTDEAANSFLKLLEETSKKSIIILISSNLRTISPTVRSRCQILKFSLPCQKETERYLIDECQLSSEKAKKFYALSLGRPGLALRYLEEKETLESVKKEASNFIDFLESLEDFNLRFELTRRLDIEILSIWLQVVRDLILVQLNLPSSNLLPEEKFRVVLQKYPLNKLMEMVRNIKETIFYLSRNVNHVLATGNLIISF